MSVFAIVLAGRTNRICSFLDAKEVLLRAALIEHFDDETITVHRLVQSAVLSQLSSSEKVQLTNYAIHLLLEGFPNTWEHDVGHQFSAWKTCETCLPHVNFLVRQIKKWKLEISDPQSFSDLVLRCCWYETLTIDPKRKDINYQQVSVREGKLLSGLGHAWSCHRKLY